MVRKATTSKSAAKKADARKQAAPKPAARPSPSPAKTVPRKEQPGHGHAQAVRPVVPPKPKAAVASKAPVKRPVAAAKPMPPKPQGKPPVAALKPTATPAGHMRPIAQAAQTGARVVGDMAPVSPPRQFGQPAAALAAAKPAAQKTMLPRQQSATGTAPAAAAANKKPVNQRHGFKTNECIVYPAHGVGRIVGIEEQEIAGMSLELFVITFEKDKMTLRVPTGKSASVGMRKLADEGVVKRAMETLKGRARIKRTMWSRRAQEYEAKINSGDLVAIAEVVRDLYRSESQPEQSYSERQLYEAALDRMAREIAAVEKLDERGAVQRITEVLSKSAKGRRAAAEETEVKAA
ncbi:MAG TPA: CarD family transcriptional regulator [Hyphomicrobiaceae bacterium]|nr:CarD family transcriptional regulator [Hyphomicrobiaceae bacterium]